MLVIASVVIVTSMLIECCWNPKSSVEQPANGNQLSRAKQRERLAYLIFRLGYQEELLDDAEKRLKHLQGERDKYQDDVNAAQTELNKLQLEANAAARAAAALKPSGLPQIQLRKRGEGDNIRMLRTLVEKIREVVLRKRNPSVCWMLMRKLREVRLRDNKTSDPGGL